jgi:hypothetical protein
MKLKTFDGQEIVLGPGCVIGFHRDNRYIVLTPRSGSGERIKWPNGDDKNIAPSCVRTEQDFHDIVQLFAKMLGLRAVKDEFKRSYGPAYRLVE